MARNTSSGCSTALVIVVAVIGLAGLGLFLSIFFLKSSHESLEQAHLKESTLISSHSQEFDHENQVTFSTDALPRYEKYQQGEALTRELFVAFTLDDDTTMLARQNFETIAEGAPVTWLLKVHELREASDQIFGQMEIPYLIVSPGDSSRSWSSVSVTCAFAASEKENLLIVRKGEWLTVSGTLTLQNNDYRILNPTIVTKN
jgi:hypothetical protein